MLRLHGFSSSNYYNIAKLALLEKGAEFEEVTVYSGAGPTYRPDFFEASPLGKVPCLQTEHGFLSESRCIVDYVERALPGPALYPESPFGQAKLLELTQVIDLYLELPTRRLIGHYFSRTSAHPRLAAEVLATVRKGVRAVPQLMSFEAHALGGEFSAADIACVIHFPVVRQILQKVLSEDPLDDVAGLEAYVQRLQQRPTVQRVLADQKASYPKFVAHLQEQHAL